MNKHNYMIHCKHRCNTDKLQQRQNQQIAHTCWIHQASTQGMTDPQVIQTHTQAIYTTNTWHQNMNATHQNHNNICKWNHNMWLNYNSGQPESQTLNNFLHQTNNWHNIKPTQPNMQVHVEINILPTLEVETQQCHAHVIPPWAI